MRWDDDPLDAPPERLPGTPEKGSGGLWAQLVLLTLLLAFILTLATCAHGTG